MFTSSVPHLTLPYRIDSDLIAIGDTTWQTKNITSISIDQLKLDLPMSEPQFVEPKPDAATKWGLFALAIAIAWTVAITTDHPAMIGWALTGASVFGVWFVRHYGHKNNLSIWNEHRDRTAKQRIVWKRLAASVPATFNLILESSSGRSVALSTLDRDSLLNVHNAILAAMRSSEASATKGSIRTLDPSSGSVEKLYERYFQGEVESA